MVAAATVAILTSRAHARSCISGIAMPSATKPALTLMPSAAPTSSPTSTSCQTVVQRLDTTMAAIANSATKASMWPPITSSVISSGFATHNSTARTGSAAVRSST